MGAGAGGGAWGGALELRLGVRGPERLGFGDEGLAASRAGWTRGGGGEAPDPARLRVRGPRPESGAGGPPFGLRSHSENPNNSEDPASCFTLSPGEQGFALGFAFFPCPPPSAAREAGPELRGKQAPVGRGGRVNAALWRAARDSPSGSICRLRRFALLPQKGKGSLLKGLPRLRERMGMAHLAAAPGHAVVLA